MLTFRFDLESWEEDKETLFENRNEPQNYPSPSICFSYKTDRTSFDVEFHDNIHPISTWREFANKVRK